VPDKAALLSASDKCLASRVEHFLFHEDDMGGEPTAFATAPISGKARKIFRKLVLFTGG
jgi:hypothetical protein